MPLYEHRSTTTTRLNSTAQYGISILCQSPAEKRIFLKSASMCEGNVRNCSQFQASAVLYGTPLNEHVNVHTPSRLPTQMTITAKRTHTARMNVMTQHILKRKLRNWSSLRRALLSLQEIKLYQHLVREGTRQMRDDRR